MSSWEEAYEAVLESNVLGSSKRQHDLLSHLLEKSAAGQSEQISAYSIAIDVFGRSKDFDPQTDSIVRAEMSRLRKSLNVFNGGEHGFQFDLPKGSFKIQFTQETVTSTSKPRLKAFMSGGVALIVGVFLLWTHLSSQPKSTDNLQPIDETFKITYYIEVDQVNSGERTKLSMAKLESRLHALAAWGPLSSPSTDPNQDYTLKFSNDDKLLCILIYTRSGKLIWSKKYTMPEDGIDPISDVLVRKVYMDVFFTVGFLPLYHATNIEISETKQYLYKCAFAALTHTIEFAPKYLQSLPLDCLRPELTRLAEEKSLIHVLRANIYSQAHIGGIKTKASSPLILAKSELKKAEKLAYKTLGYHIVNTKILSYKQPLDLKALNESVGELLENSSTNPMAQYYGAFVYGYYLGNWEKATLYADMISARQKNRRGFIHQIYTMHFLTLNDHDQALEHYNLIVPEISKFAAARDIAFSCTLKPESDLSEIGSQAKSQGLATKKQYIDYVKFRNFHAAVSDIYLDKKVLEDCSVFATVM